MESPRLALMQAINAAPLVVEPATPLAEVVALMNRSWQDRCDVLEPGAIAADSRLAQHSCALVVADGSLVGIFTERDVVRLIATGGLLNKAAIAEVMTQPVISLIVTDTQDIFAALRLMREHRIRHLPIVDTCDRLLGIVTPRSVRQGLEPTDLLKLRRVKDVMSSEVIQAPPTSSVMALAQLMTQHRVSCVVITEATQAEGAALARPLGIITERDILQFRLLEFNLDQLQAKAVMSAPLFLVSPEDSLWTVHYQMQQHLTRRLVVASSQGALQGIVTQTHILQVLDPLEMYGVLELLQRKVTELEARNIQLLQQCTTQLEHEIEAKESERRQAEQKIREQAMLLDVTTDAILVRDCNQIILFWNRGAERLYGWTAAEAVGQNANQLLYREPLPKFEAIQTALYQAGQWQGELYQVTKAGRNIVVESRWSPMPDDSEGSQSTLVVNTDITEKKQLEQQFLRAQRLESIGTLAGGIAHDLNNILTPVLGVANLLPMHIRKDNRQALHLLRMLQSR
ncbi:MAG: CBS domain-containing protein, partial [Leptolyngbya sp. SIO4C1]|nr:CBS domain-containing protein [Leptolyngbya sp. SIO4C1]